MLADGPDPQGWTQRYMQAIVEVDGAKMPERIAAVRQAIEARLRDLAHDRDHHAERHEIENALGALKTIEVETRESPKATLVAKIVVRLSRLAEKERDV